VMTMAQKATRSGGGSPTSAGERLRGREGVRARLVKKSKNRGEWRHGGDDGHFKPSARRWGTAGEGQERGGGSRPAE
jgi:hypothetical protein